MKVFLSPHNDDAVLFGTFTILAHRPLVLTIFDSHLQEARGSSVTAEQRRDEDCRAMSVLGTKVSFLGVSDGFPDMGEIEAGLRTFGQPEMVYAPAIESGGHEQHNLVGEIARKVFRNVTFYATYTRNGKSAGVRVPFEPDWPLKKLKALACYESQICRADNRDHFLREQYEYLAA